MMEEEIRETDIKIKVVEKAGTKVKRQLQRNDPFKEKECPEESCFICSTTKKVIVEPQE